jgi:signal transduction histidine kinase
MKEEPGLFRGGPTAVWEKLVAPSLLIRDPEEARLSRLLASSLILVLPLIILVGWVFMPIALGVEAPWQSATFLPATIAIILSFVSYGVNRLGKNRLAARLYIFGFIFAPWLAVVQESNPINLPIAMLMLGGVLLAGILTPDRWTQFTAALGTVLGMILLPVISDSVELADTTAVFSVIVTLDVLIIIFSYYRNRLESDRQEKLQASHVRLLASSQYNDQRLSELIDTIVAISTLNFSVRAPVTGRGDMFDALATGLNALAEELMDTVISKSQLEEMVALRTSQLEAANLELSNFAYVASHDLKAPLRAVSQLSTWIAEDYSEKLDEAGREKLTLLVERTRHMHKLIEGILAYSRIGRVSEKVGIIDLNELVQDVIRALDPPPTIHVAVADPLPYVRAEVTYLTQVFQNLLGNAIQYIDKPEGHVTIRCDDQATDWLFAIADNGPGIDPKYHGKIFQMFQTLGLRKNVEGTGIGLALVKRIIEKWDGKIWVESTIGKGSTFFFTMPKRGDADERQ